MAQGRVVRAQLSTEPDSVRTEHEVTMMSSTQQPRVRSNRRMAAAVLLVVTACIVGASGIVPARATVRGTPAHSAVIRTAVPRPTTRWSLVPVGDQFVTRSGSKLLLAGRPWRFAGINMYWLGLDENVPDAAGATYPTHAAVDNGFAAAARLGVRLVRSTSLGVSVGSPRSLEPALGRFNDSAFAAIDYAVADARAHGLRLMLPLTDEWHYYGGGKHTFTNWTGHPDIPGQTLVTDPAQRSAESYFYTDASTINAFHAYVAHLLNHVNPLTGLRLGSDPTIAIWETGNELWDAPTAWTEQTARFLKSLAPRALVADGSDASGMNITATGFGQPDVDIVDAHFYPTDAAKARSDAAFVAGRGKVYLIGEYPLTGPDVSSWLTADASDSDITGDLAWSLLPYLGDGSPEQHNDGYTFHFPGATPAEVSEDGLLQAHAVAVGS